LAATAWSTGCALNIFLHKPDGSPSFGDPSDLFLLRSLFDQPLFGFVIFFLGYDSILIGLVKILQFLPQGGGDCGRSGFSLGLASAAGSEIQADQYGEHQATSFEISHQEPPFICRNAYT
jgi:hypothetical protein